MVACYIDISYYYTEHERKILITNISWLKEEGCHCRKCWVLKKKNYFWGLKTMNLNWWWYYENTQIKLNVWNWRCESFIIIIMTLSCSVHWKIHEKTMSCFDSGSMKSDLCFNELFVNDLCCWVLVSWCGCEGSVAEQKGCFRRWWAFCVFGYLNREG